MLLKKRQLSSGRKWPHKVGMYRCKTFAVDTLRDQREQWWATTERSKRSLSHEVASKAYELGEMFIMLTH